MIRDHFGEFWNAYPRKVSVKSTREAWAIAITKAKPEVIVEAAQRLNLDPNLDLTYTPAPARWLTEERWHDGALPPRKLTPQEALDQEKKRAMERDALERQKSLELTREAEEREAKAVPMPPELKAELLQKWASKGLKGVDDE